MILQFSMQIVFLWNNYNLNILVAQFSHSWISISNNRDKEMFFSPFSCHLQLNYPL